MLTHKSRKILLIVAMAIFALVASAALLKVHAGEKPAAQAAPAPAAVDPQFAKMQAQMEKLASTRDPKERQRLLDEHLAAMQAMMATMHGTAGGMMGGGDTMCSRMMPMHQMMMDQMAQHQHAMMQPPPK